MTYIYEYFSLPNEVDIICPKCQGHAVFFQAKVKMIERKADVAFFQNNKLFDYVRIDTPYYYHTTKYGAVFYPNLTSLRQLTQSDLPQGYALSHFYLLNEYLGTCVCRDCRLRQKHRLDWEKEAYYQTMVKNQQLWAFNRQHLIDIRDFIESTTRREKDYPNWLYLLHLPTVFKQHKNREDVVKKIDKLLNQS